MIGKDFIRTRAGSRSSLEADAEALHWAVSDLVRVYQFRDRDRICCYDISVTQCYALEALAEHGPVRLGALAERLHLDKSTTSRVVATLVRKGYAAQGPEARDRRAVAIAVTRAGRRLYERIIAGLIEQQKLVVQDFDPQVRAGVVEVIRRLASAASARFLAGVSVGDRDAACTCDMSAASAR
jgi:MarR family transcriptional regulator, 2-MHQ and catechol-resistance regulon repressor